MIFSPQIYITPVFLNNLTNRYNQVTDTFSERKKVTLTGFRKVKHAIHLSFLSMDHLQVHYQKAPDDKRSIQCKSFHGWPIIPVMMAYGIYFLGIVSSLLHWHLSHQHALHLTQVHLAYIKGSSPKCQWDIWQMTYYSKCEFENQRTQFFTGEAVNIASTEPTNTRNQSGVCSAKVRRPRP